MQHHNNAQATDYVECRTADGKNLFGCGLDTDVATASVRAILSAAKRGLIQTIAKQFVLLIALINC